MHADTKWDAMYTLTGLQEDRGEREDIEKGQWGGVENPVQWRQGRKKAQGQ